MSAAETIRLEEYTGIIQNRVVAAWQAPDAVTPWLPTEFMLSQYITRILVTGRTAAMSTALAADQSWTQVWRSPGAKEWSCLLGVLPHMPGPVLIVVGTDIALSPKLMASLRAAVATAAGSGGSQTVVVLRQTGLASHPAAGWAGEPADQVFFPAVEMGSSSATGGGRFAGIVGVISEWATRTSPRTLDTKLVLPQLAAQGYGLCAAEGLWHWYKPADSPPLVPLTTGQIARQLQTLGVLLEKVVL
jgi:hypothetical protein